MRPLHVRALSGIGSKLPALVLLLVAGSMSPALAGKDDINVTIDEALIVKIDRPAAEIIVGNPSIADVAVQSSKLLVVTGKSFGRTNLIVVDTNGKEVINRMLSVQEASTGIVSLQRGTGRRYSYYCAPKCAVELAIGDEPGYFGDISKQIQTKQRLGQSTATGDTGGGGE
jgi:hypothetical protein